MNRFRRLLLVLLVGVGIVSILVYVLPIPITLRKAESRAFFDYVDNLEDFNSIADHMSTERNFVESLLDIEFAQDILIPDTLSTIGIGSIYEIEDVVYFEYYDSIMGVTPFGILRAKDVSVLDEWYRIKQIEGNWYFYRIAS